MSQTIIIAGCGIAGISCLDALINDFNRETSLFTKIILISEGRLIKTVKNFRVLGRNMESFDVVETDSNELSELEIPSGLTVEFVMGSVKCVDTKEKTITIRDSEKPTQPGRLFHYDILSICAGARPKKFKVPGVDCQSVNQHIVTIRDTTSVINLKTRLAFCRRVAIIGNGGISLGLVDKISGCQKIWIARDEFMGCPFLDSEASKFFTDLLDQTGNSANRAQGHPVYDQASTRFTRGEDVGPAVGPDWLQVDLCGNGNASNDLAILYDCQIESLKPAENCDFPVVIQMTDGKKIECDLIVIAIGVVPNLPSFRGDMVDVSSSDGGIIIDEQMRTSVEKIYAAGDVVSCEKWPTNSLWFQMRLWTQARQMGHYCEFFGKKVVLLGRYNAQDMNDDEASQLEVLARVRTRHDYVKLTLKSGVVIGAILVGDTHLEETIENLIHDAIDVSQIKDQLLDDTVDIEDYFD